MAGLLARRGWHVHVLCCGTRDGEDAPSATPGYPPDGVVETGLDDLPTAAWVGRPSYGDGTSSLVLSQRVMEALEHLQAEQPFDVIEFPDRGALGFRAAQAKRSAVAFSDVALAVRLHDFTQWRRRESREYRRTPWDLKLEWCERYACERADLQLSSSWHMVDEARACGWDVRDDVVVHGPPADVHDRERWGDEVEERYRDALAAHHRAPVSAHHGSGSGHAVSLVVTHFNHAEFLPAALASIASQTRPPDEVFVIDDSSTDEHARRVFEQQRVLYPAWTFLVQENAGPDAARNHALALATGTFFLPFDSDNIARPELIETLLGAMRHDPGRAVASCHLLAFDDDGGDLHIDADAGLFRFAPTGGPRILAGLENLFGDTCALYRADALRAVGGFDEAREPPGDWEVMTKLAFAGFDVDVVPRPLFWYRARTEGRLHTLAADPGYPFRQGRRMIDTYLVGAPLDALERTALWECLASMDRMHDELEQLQAAHDEVTAWATRTLEANDAWRQAQLQETRAFLEGKLQEATERAERAERELQEIRSPGPIRARLRRWRDIRQ